MELTRKTGTRRWKTGKIYSCGLFFCPYCRKEVEKELGSGKKNKSCGCMHQNHGHGGYGTKLFGVWNVMIQRCVNPNVEMYKNYGGRGISVCDEWKSYPVFLKWAMEAGYREGLQIDRIDSNGNYESSNCRFVTCAVNSRNRRNNKLNWPKVNLLRAMYRSGGISQKKLGDLFSISQSCVWYIVAQKAWKP